MDYFIVILLLAIPVVVAVYYFYDRIKADKSILDNRGYVEGLIALLDGDDRRAFTRFREVVNIDTGNIDAYLRIGDIFRRNGKPERALQVHQDLTMRHDLSPRQRASVQRAVTCDYLDLKDFKAAARSLKEYNNVTGGGDVWSLSALLTLQDNAGDWEEAFVTHEKLLKLKNELSRKPLAKYKVKQADHLAEQKRYHQARIAYKEALNLDDQYAGAYLSIGDTYIIENRIEDAIGIWKKMVANTPDQAGLALERLEKALFEVGRFGEIEDICMSMIRLDPSNLEARLKLAGYFAKKADYESAEEQLLQALENNPDSYRPALELARLYLRSKKEEKIHRLIGILERKESGKIRAEAG